MCGITGIVSSSNVSAKLLKSLLNLEYRGYDSCGIAVLNGSGIEVRKDQGNVQSVSDGQSFLEVEGKVGIGHTRWATTGIPNQINAHPHVSCSGTFALVHNGIISNYRQLRAQLQSAGHHIVSDTDTEILVHLIEDFYNKTGHIELALRQATQVIEGTYAFAFITTHAPEHIFCARRQSPLILGLGDGENYIGSDHNAILEYTRRVITISDGDYAVLNRHAAIVKRLDTGELVNSEIKWVNWDPELSKKGGFPHYMLKEIHEQPTVIDTVLKIDPRVIQTLAEEVQVASRSYLCGIGTTYYVAMISQYYFARLAGVFIPAISSDEFSSLAQVDAKSLLIAFSQSGETYDTLHALRHAKKSNARTAAIINVMGSTMVDTVDMAIMQASGPEICVLSTKAAIAQIMVSIRTALELGRSSGFLNADQYQDALTGILSASDAVRRVINETKGFINAIAKRHAHIENWLFIGRGIYSGIALEAALKMKEVSYRHCEGIPGGFMKHGTIALIEDGVGSLFFLPPASEKEQHELTIANAEEIKARKGFLVGFGFGEKSPVFDEQIMLPDVHPLIAPLILLILGQLFAYYSAVALNRNVDKPRSLAKSVTVA